MTAALSSVGVQQVTVTIANGATTGTATITAVGTGAFIVWQGDTTTDTTTIVSSDTRVDLTNTTTVTATRNTSSTDTVTVTAVVIDGNTTNLVKTVQSGTTTITTASTTGTTTVSAVTNTNTAIHGLGSSSASAASFSRADCSVTLATTTVTATRSVSTGQDVAGWCVVEYQGTALNSSTQNVTITSTASGTSFTTTVTSVTTGNTMLAWSGFVNSQSTNPAKGFPRLSLAAATTAQADYNTAPAVTTMVSQLVVVEFVAAILAQTNQRGTIALAAATSNTATITSAATAQTLANWLGNSSTEATFDPATARHKITQTNATTLTQTVNSSASGTGSYEVITFNAAAAGNTVTETVTETDSYTAIATDSASFTETQTGTDSYIGKTTSTPLTFSETQTESDSLTALSTGKGLLTETQTETDSATISASSSVTRSETTTETDNLSGVITASDGTTENVTSTDTHAALATGNIAFSELESANDNYDSQLTPSGGTVPAPVTGSGNDPWKRHLLWLARKKRKQFKQRAMQAGISKPEAAKIADIATQEVQKQETGLKTPYYVTIDQNEQLARYAAQVAINQIYESIWEQKVREAIAYRQEQIRLRNEEDEFFMMVM